MTNKVHSLKYNAIMNSILSVSNIIFPLVTFPYVARVLLPSGNGKIAFAASVANYFVLLASLGIPTYGVRACAIVRDDKDKLSKTVQEIFIINLIATIIVSAVYFVCVFAVPKFAAEKSLFLLNGITIVLNMFGMNWVFQALEQYDYITFRSIFFKLVSIVLMFIMVRTADDYVLYAGITVFAAVGSYCLNILRVRKIINFTGYRDYNFRQHLRPIFILFAQSLAISVYTNLDTVMLGLMKADTEVGFYNAAVKIKLVLFGVITAYGSVLLPRMSYYFRHGMDKRFRAVMVSGVNVTEMLSVPLAAFFVVFASEVMTLVAGNEYTEAVLPMRIIVTAIIPIGVAWVLGIQVLTPMGKEIYVLYSAIAGAAADLVLNFILIPPMGAAGASLATLAAEILVMAMQIYFLKDLFTEIKGSLRLHVYFAAAAVCAAVSLLMHRIPFDSAFIVLAVNAVVYFGLYFMILFAAKEPMLVRLADETLKRANIGRK